MIWCKVIIAIIWLLLVRLNAIYAIFGHTYTAPVQLVCVKDSSQDEFTQFELVYNKKMSKNQYTFNTSIIDQFKEMIGNNSEIVLFLVGNEDRVKYLSGTMFSTSKDQTEKYNVASCVATYKYLKYTSPYLEYYKTVKNRVPKVVDILAAFIKTIIESPVFNIITLNQVFIMGFCLGGHIAGNLGQRLQLMFPRRPGAIWAFDPTNIGFPVEKLKNGSVISVRGKPRRVQKGDAEIVIVFHTSRMGVEENMADIDIIVNDGKNQPDCRLRVSNTICSHISALILYELCVQTNLPERWENGFSSGIARESGFPLAFKTKNCSEHPETDGCIKFQIKFTDPPKGHKGIYYMHTEAVFDTPTTNTVMGFIRFWG